MKDLSNEQREVIVVRELAAPCWQESVVVQAIDAHSIHELDATTEAARQWQWRSYSQRLLEVWAPTSRQAASQT